MCRHQRSSGRLRVSLRRGHRGLPNASAYHNVLVGSQDVSVGRGALVTAVHASGEQAERPAGGEQAKMPLGGQLVERPAVNTGSQTRSLLLNTFFVLFATLVFALSVREIVPV